MVQILKKENNEEKKLTYPEQINRLRFIQAPPETLLEVLDEIARDFFRKRYHTNKNEEYSDLQTYFEKKNIPGSAAFCGRMLETIYSGQDVSKERVMDLIADLEFITDKEDPSKSEEIEHKSALSEILEKLGVFETTKEKKEKEYFPDKNTTKVIQSKLKKQTKTQKNIKDSKETVQEKSTQIEENSIEVVKSPPQKEKEILFDPTTVKIQDEHIENIDDLFRIRQKLKDKPTFTSLH